MRSYAVWGAAALCAAVASIMAEPGIPGLLGAGLAVVMIAIAAVDARRFVIPDLLVVAALALGFAAAARDPSSPLTMALLDAALRGIALALAFFLFRAAYRYLRGREGIGLGDVKLAAVAGVWLPWMAVAVAVDVAALSALAVVLIAAWRGQRITGTTAVPFGLFFAPAIWIAWLVEAMSVRLAG
ncbi:MAG TPA: A24 family peptidase [Xanthobacteraceae bacterium]|nr:A24 family peptidase [Xanthobacteraceae bacterium]